MKRGQQERRERALARWEAQLASGVKTKSRSFDKIPMTEQDIKRVQKQIDILKTKV